MCGRMQSKNPPTWAEIHAYYSAFTIKKSHPDWRPGDMNPGDPVPIVALRDGERRITAARWWLVPSFATELKSRYKMFNARADNLIEQYRWWQNLPPSLSSHKGSAYLAPFKEGRRCLMPVNGYYEFKNGKPYLFTLTDQWIFSVAGLWEWAPKVRTPDWPKGVISCTMITTEPNAIAAPIHDRMPVIVRPEDYDVWLDPKRDMEEVIALMRPYDGDNFAVRAVAPPMSRYDTLQPNMF